MYLPTLLLIVTHTHFKPLPVFLLSQLLAISVMFLTYLLRRLRPLESGPAAGQSDYFLCFL